MTDGAGRPWSRAASRPTSSRTQNPLRFTKATRYSFRLLGSDPPSSVYSCRCGRNTLAACNPSSSDSASIGRGKTHRVGGRKYHRNNCRGFYNHEWRGQPAWIQLVTDNIVAGYSASLLRLQLFRDHAIAQTLYHEVGHHLHETVGLATRGGEEAAEDWSKRLSKIHIRRRYWYLRPVILVLKTLVRFLRRFDRFRPHARSGEAG